jgi:predicted DNA-binding transcriptional regulator AlpA
MCMKNELLSDGQAIKLLTEKEAAKLLAVSVPTLRRWRLFPGRGPKFRKLHKCVRYAETDLQEFIDAAARTSTGEAA